jgi:Cu(I)/Ag(I) efflux system membrane fusion protein
MRTTTTRTIPVLVTVLLLGCGLAACRRGAGTAAKAEAAKTQYQCPMHPSYVSDRPGQCPICKMDLVPMQPAAAAGGPLPVVAGRAMVALSPERRQLLGVRSEAVTRRHLDRTIRTVGRVAMDERRLHHVHTKYEAYVEKLYVNFIGQMVRKGDHLAALYAPELVATQQEYLLAYRAQQRLSASGIPSVAKGGSDLLEAARQRLLFWDVAPADIEALERTGQVQRTVDLHAELPGYVLQKSAVHGMRVTPADILFDIADLSAVWILADVYESDLATVELGMAAEVTLPYQPGRTWRGTVAFVNPIVEPGTRTVKVRVEVANQDYALKPDMFADVVLRRELGDALFVPESAVLKPGDRQIVFLDRGDGRLEPREIETGARVEGGYAVLSGIAEGDKVVTSANFLIDSESSLKAALSSMSAAPSATPHSAHAPFATAPAAPPKARSTPPPKVAAYACPMHAEVTSDKPGSCRICGMDLASLRRP